MGKDGVKKVTFEELNIVRRLRKKLDDEQQKLKALTLCADSITPQFTRGNDGCTCLDTSPKAKVLTSRPENIAVLLTEAESRIADTQTRIAAESLLLTDKIQREAKNDKDSALLIHRYVNCRHFRDIGILMGFSEAHVYFTHRNILRYLLQ